MPIQETPSGQNAQCETRETEAASQGKLEVAMDKSSKGALGKWEEAIASKSSAARMGKKSAPAAAKMGIRSPSDKAPGAAARRLALQAQLALGPWGEKDGSTAGSKLSALVSKPHVSKEAGHLEGIGEWLALDGDASDKLCGYDDLPEEPGEEENGGKSRLHRIDKLRMDREEAAFEHALSVVGVIPASEWGMPMTMWAVVGEMSAEILEAWLQECAGKPKSPIEAGSSTVWVASTTDATAKAGARATPDAKLGDVVFIEQGPGAREAAKAALLAGRFVVWMCASSAALDSYAKDNACGVVECPNSAQRTASWLGRMRARGWGMDTPRGLPAEDAILALAHGSSCSPSVVKAAACAIEEAFEACANALCVVQEEEHQVSWPMEERAWSRIERCYGFQSVEQPDIREGDPARLADAVGLTPATRAALERLVRRIKGAGKGRGVLLHGLPGAGKTMLAKVLAVESGRRWVEASYARWQSCEHLGEHLAAMSESFKEAISKAPSVMFIDELDSVGSREGQGRNSSYQVPVINAMLEWVQEALERGVVVVGASNYPEKIDPALVRPGRLGEWVEIERPGKAERTQLIAKALPGVEDASSWAGRVGAASPAKIVELARDARELAAERGALHADSSDVERALAAEVAKALGGRLMSSLAEPVAIGLCAKAWAIEMARLGGVEVPKVMGADIRPGIEEVGRLDVEGAFGQGSGEAAWARLQVTLAPAAARVAKARLGADSGPAGLSALADIDQADRVEAMRCLRELSASGLAGQSGEGAGRIWIEPERGVAELADVAWAAALASAHKALPAIEAASKLLVKRASLDGAQLRRALGLLDLESERCQGRSDELEGWIH